MEQNGMFSIDDLRQDIGVSSAPSTQISGGRANEAGSAFRAGCASYFAAYGIADVSLPIEEADRIGPPAWQWLETSKSVDDIRCKFVDGTTWDIQAKRTCSWGATFKSVIQQWISAINAGGDVPERIVLVTQSPSSPLLDLSAALRRLRAVDGSDLLPSEATAYKRLQDQSIEDGWNDVFESVVSRAMIIQLSTGGATGQSLREASALLEGTVVARGHGVAAVNALMQFFQTEAVRSGGSNAESWLRVLDRAGMSTGQVAGTPAGRALLLYNYRNSLRRRVDLLDVDHFSIGVEPLLVRDLLDSFEVDIKPEDGSEGGATASLADIARRWRRLGVIGLPGSGKSTAFEQLAAAWADDIEAPLPILIRLRRLVPMLRDRRIVEIVSLCELADGATSETVPLLVERLMNGTAVLILDGLDECRDMQSAAATLVTRISGDIHADSGLILSTREVAASVANMTSLPFTVLREPKNGRSLSIQLLKHIVMTSKPDARDSDLVGPLQWMHESRETHPDIWSIPLFAVLLCTHAALSSDSELPATRAEALVTAVEDSVLRWESVKADEPGAWHPDLHPELLVQGFAAIGHEVVLGDAEYGSVESAVASAVTRWTGSASAQAQAAGRDIIRWWIGRVGVFSQLDGFVTARLRLMGEVGDAMWIAQTTPEQRNDWIEQVVSDPKRFRESVLLAAALNREVIIELIIAAHSASPVLLASDAVLQGAVPTEAAMTKLVESLIRLAEGRPQRKSTAPTPLGAPVSQRISLNIDERQIKHDGPGWEFLIALVGLPLHASLRERRDAAIRSCGSSDRGIVATALAATSDCKTDSRSPSTSERKALEAVLALPVPKDEPVAQHRSRRHLSFTGGEPLLRGHVNAVIGAVEILGIDEQSADNIARVAESASVGESDRLNRLLRESGFSDKNTLLKELKSTFSGILKGFEDHREFVRFVLQEAAIPTSRQNSTAGESSWRLTAAAALFEVLEFDKHRFGTDKSAMDNFPEIVRYLVQLAATGTGFTRDALASTCRYTIDLFDRSPIATSILLDVPPDPFRTTTTSIPEINSTDLPMLRAAIESGNDALFWTAAEWLTEDGNADSVAVLVESLSLLCPPHRRVAGRWLIEFSEDEDMASEWLSGEDPILGLAAAESIAHAGDDQSLIMDLARSPDQTVRLTVLSGLAANAHLDVLQLAIGFAMTDNPTRWTCRWCGSVELMSAWDCTSCTSGDRPDLGERVADLAKKHLKGSAASIESS
jgi:hypothetical protein